MRSQSKVFSGWNILCDEVVCYDGDSLNFHQSTFRKIRNLEQLQIRF